jgi:beta-lactamase class D
MNRSVSPARPMRWRQRLNASAIGLAFVASVWAGSALAIDMPWSSEQKAPTGACFLLFEAGKGEIRRKPSQVCKTRVTPASTFKIPHALIALDTGAVAGPDEVIRWDGKGDWPESSRRDHTLASALRNSVVWYFQEVAKRVGEKQEASYLNKFDYGNRDSESGLTTFWLGGSLQITPEEQLAFLRRFYDGKLPVKFSSMSAVQAMLVQPQGVVVNSQGEQPFDAPWPEGASVSAKTGSATDADGRSVRWLVGRVRRDGHVYFFVSCVIGGKDLGANAAIDLAATSLRENGVL